MCRYDPVNNVEEYPRRRLGVELAPAGSSIPVAPRHDCDLHFETRRLAVCCWSPGLLETTMALGRMYDIVPECH